jgi:hypothetical protein
MPQNDAVLETPEVLLRASRIGDYGYLLIYSREHPEVFVHYVPVLIREARKYQREEVVRTLISFLSDKTRA